MSDDTAAPIRILLVDDHELIRSGLGAVLDLEDDMDVVGTAGSVTEAIARYEALSPDVVVADLQLQDGTGLDIVRTIRKQSNDTGLIVLTMHSGDDQIFAAMQAGASGFVGLTPRLRLCGSGRRDDAPAVRRVDQPQRTRARRPDASRRGAGRCRHRGEALPQ